MRLWSIHPKYLDCKGLVAVWREALLAKKVLKGDTKGYKNHPQLIRFKNTDTPILYIDTYLSYIWKEAMNRGYNFNKNKFKKYTEKKLKVNDKQLEYEFNHLKKKLQTRDPKKYEELIKKSNIEPHPLFKVIKGKIEVWELIKDPNEIIK